MTENPGDDFSLRNRVLKAWLLVSLSLFLLRLVGDHVPIMGVTGWLWITRFAEAWTVAGLVVLSVTPLPVKRIVDVIGRVRSVVLAGLFLALFAGQYLQFEAYPFVKWNMYGVSTASLEYYEFAMIEDGEDIGPLPLFGETTVTKEPRALLGALGDLAVAAQEGRRGAAVDLHDAVAAFAMRSDRNLDAVDVRRCVVDSEQLTEATCHPITTVELDVAGQ